jgi:hypothetical protein
MSPIAEGGEEKLIRSAGGSGTRWKSMNRAMQCALLVLVVFGLAGSSAARSYLNCLATKIIIADTPSGSTSSRVEEHFGLWIDEKAKTLALADGTPLAVRRFDEHWISAVRDDMFYEFDRQTGNLSYASSTTKNGAVTITIGSGRCAHAAAPTG